MWPAVSFRGAADQGFRQDRAIVGIGHHHHALAFAGKQDQIDLVAGILAPIMRIGEPFEVTIAPPNP